MSIFCLFGGSGRGFGFFQGTFSHNLVQGDTVLSAMDFGDQCPSECEMQKMSFGWQCSSSDMMILTSVMNSAGMQNTGGYVAWGMKTCLLVA